MFHRCASQDPTNFSEPVQALQTDPELALFGLQRAAANSLPDAQLLGVHLGWLLQQE